MILLLLSLSVFAQAQDKILPEVSKLDSKDLPYYVIELIKSPAKFDIPSYLKKKFRGEYSVEIQLFPFSRQGISAKRISTPGTIGKGSALGDWTEQIKYDLSPEPRFNYRSGNMYFDSSGGSLSAQNLLRHNYYLDGDFARDLAKFVTISASGAYEGESSPATSSGIFSSDILRRSYSFSGGGGFKLGQFNGKFFSIQNQAGHAVSEAQERADNFFEPATLDRESFLTDSWSFGAGWRFDNSKLIRGAIIQTWYQNLVSHEPGFASLMALVTAELRPIPQFEKLAFVVNTNFDLGNKDHLMFRNDPPLVLVRLKYVFNITPK